MNAKLIVLWGKNSAETNIHQMLHVDCALKQGAQLVVIDPRRTETAERADLLVQLRPGTDGALALALGHVLVRDGLVDHDFIAEHVLGYYDYAALVAGYSPETVAPITELAAGTIESLAHLLGTVRPCTISPGFGMQRYTNSGQSLRAMLALLAITGNHGKPGAGWMYANLQTQVFSPVKDPLDFYPPKDPAGSVRISISTARLGRDMLRTTDPPLTFAGRSSGIVCSNYGQWDKSKNYGII